MITCAAVGFIQIFYWKYASGDWIVYSYREQGFSWLKPHLIDGIFSYKSGWLTYSPFMIFSLLGFYHLYRQHRGIFASTLIFAALFIYIAFAWDEWWYGGALGQRAMVQSYAVLAFPLAAFFGYFQKAKRYIQIPIALFMTLFIYANLWWTHQAHLGGMLHVGQMRKAYFWKTLLTHRNNPENLKLLDDVNVVYEGEFELSELIYSDTMFKETLGQDVQFSTLVKVPFENSKPYEWIRASADFAIQQKEWSFWTMTQFVVEVYDDDEKLDVHMIRVQRHMNDNQQVRLHIDIPKPEQRFTELQIKLWNAGGNKEIRVSNLSVEIFNSEE